MWRDVTWLTRFDSNDSGTVSVTPGGMVTAQRHGETAIRVAYQDVVAAVIVTVPHEQNVPAEKFDEYHQRLVDKGVAVSDILNHDDSEWGVSREVTDDVFVRSVYFFDPDGILLEFASWTRDLNESDVRHEPARALSRSATT